VPFWKLEATEPTLLLNLETGTEWAAHWIVYAKEKGNNHHARASSSMSIHMPFT
jgi:hypothetical protein